MERSASLITDTGGDDPAGTFACVAAASQAHEAELRGCLRHRMADADADADADAEAADDVLQDVFVKAMRQRRRFCSLDNSRAWLFQVARNAVVDRLLMFKTLEPLTDDLAESTPLTAQPIAPIDALSECVVRTLSELPPEDAAILRACDLEGQAQVAFAQAHGLSLPAAKSRLLRARQRLRDRLTTVCQVRFEPDGSVRGHAGRRFRRRADQRRAHSGEPSLAASRTSRGAILAKFGAVSNLGAARAQTINNPAASVKGSMSTRYPHQTPASATSTEFSK